MVVRKRDVEQRWGKPLILLCLVFASILPFVSANTYVTDLSFTVPESIYGTGDRIELKGALLMKNYSTNGTLVSNLTPITWALINITLRNATANVSSYNLTTDAAGFFYSRSDFYTTVATILAPSTAGDYFIRAVYQDPNNASWFSEVAIRVVNQTIDFVRVSSDKATYNPSESMLILAEALQIAGDRVLYVSNVTVNGSVRNATSKEVLSSFNCTTGTNGKCSVRVTAPSVYGDYLIEVNDFKAFSSIMVVPFFANMYMKDELGKSVKNTFSLGEQASVEVSVVTNSTSDYYTFSGYIADAQGNVVKLINSTALTTNNSYINKFVFTVDSLTFAYGSYFAKVTVSKQGDGSIDLVTSFEVKDWALSVAKKETGSNFEYDYSTFANKSLLFEIYPKYRGNGSIIPGINTTAFTVNISDKLNNNIGTANVSWNASCGKAGCYDLAFVSPLVLGQYLVTVTLSFGGDVQSSKNVFYVIDTLISAQATNVDGNIKELFGTNELVYLSLSSYNTTTTGVNLSDAEVFLVTFMNGTEVSYTNVSTWSLVNSTNNVSEWAWNASVQRFKMDVPKSGGIYSVIILAKNRSIASVARFIVNPYEICSSTKNTPGQVNGGGISSGSYYYVWQFKTTDTVYFELKVIQANNPLGKATASNFSVGNGSSSYGMGSACSVNTQTQQVVNNATVSVLKVLNTQNGASYAINTSQSVCTSMDTSGGYTCTVAPAVKWDGGTYSVEMKITGLDGSSDLVYGLFEARAFYLYGYSTTWQNSPNNNISLSVSMYEAGKNWWSNYGSGGLSGTVKVEKIEYMGREGEWVWPPVDSGYNVSRLNATSISTGQGTLAIPVSFSKKGSWDTGYYRVILKGTDASGNVDYGYAWFTVKLWDAYGIPLECTPSGCNYKSYFNSKENISIYVKISNAGGWNYNDNGGQSLGGNVTITVKKIQDCRRWPCKDLNATEFNASKIVVNASSGWYWNSNTNSTRNYTLQINKTDGKWGTGWFSVLLDVNGTETGYAWFNTIAFYVDTRPTDVNGTNWKYNIRPSETIYYNTTLTRGYMGWNVAYNASDFLNASIDDAVLRTWDYTTYQSKDYNYPEDINITVVNKTGVQANGVQVQGNALLNLSYKNGSWPTGYYWGELIMRNADNETSTGWLWFSVQPFRVEVSTSTYEVDNDACVNATLNIRDPDWTSNTLLSGNYTITSVYENIWSGSGSTTVTYTNYTNTTFNGTVTAQFCPNNGRWGGGSWGGYHSLNLVVKDASDNATQTGWLSFRTQPFRTSWTVVGGSDKRTNELVNVTVSLTKPLSGAAATGNITKIYQWRYDSSTSYSSVLEEYAFTVYTNGSSACSSSSGTCFVNGTATVIITAPSRGWKVGGNYLYSDWVGGDGTLLQDYSGIYVNGLEAYNGWFEIVDANGNWKSGFGSNENVTARIMVRNASYSPVAANITSISYTLYSGNCYSDYCATYTTATWVFITNGTGIQTNGSSIIQLAVPSGGWTRGSYSLKAAVSGIAGTATITGGSFQVKDFTAPNVTISSPTMNQTIVNETFSVSATTTENAVCELSIIDYGNFYSSWYSCPSIYNSSNQTYPTSLINTCNYSYYGFNNSTVLQSVYVYRDYYSFNNNSYWEQVNGAAVSTGGTSHTYTVNVSRWRNQDYGMRVQCYDVDYNYGAGYVGFHVNYTSNDTTPPIVTVNSPLNTTYPGTITFNATLNENGFCTYTLNSGTTNYTLQNGGNTSFNATNASIADGSYTVLFYCNDTNGNRNDTKQVTFSKDSIFPSLTVSSPANTSYTNASILVNFTSNDSSGINSRWFYNGTGNTSYTNATTVTASQGSQTWVFYSNDSAGNLNSTLVTFSVDSVLPLVSFGNGTENNSVVVNRTWIYVNVSVTEVNFANITFKLYNLTALVNSTLYSTPIYFINWTNLPYTSYTYNATVVDTFGNSNSSLTRSLNLSNI